MLMFLKLWSQFLLVRQLFNSTNIMLFTPVNTSINLSSTQITCDKSNQNDVYTLSKFCVNGSDWSNLECIHDIEEQSFSRNILGIWAIIVSVAGIIGNVLTLLAVPFAADRKRWVDAIVSNITFQPLVRSPCIFIRL